MIRLLPSTVIIIIQILISIEISIFLEKWSKRYLIALHDFFEKGKLALQQVLYYTTNCTQDIYSQENVIVRMFNFIVQYCEACPKNSYNFPLHSFN